MYRRRPRPQASVAFGFDSFLDLVANVVGILIRLILVAWVGAKAYKGDFQPPAWLSSPAPAAVALAPLPSTEPEQRALNEAQTQLTSMQAELLEQLREQEQVSAERARLDQQTSLSESEWRKLQQTLSELEKQGQVEKQTAPRAELSLTEIRTQANALADELQRLRELPSTKRTLTYRTPIARTVQSEEIHFELRAGRVTFLDVEAMLREIKSGLQAKGEMLKTRWSVEDQTGPVGAFRLRYVVTRQRGLLDAAAGTAIPDPDANFSFGVDAWVAVPVAARRGETQAEAMQPLSAFRRIVDRLDVQRTAVTFWVYPDSFGLYRALRDHCLLKDVVVAGRPLPDEVPIASSRSGTASLGQ